MKFLLVIISMTGDVEMQMVSREQCYAAVSVYGGILKGEASASCFPPDAKFKVEGLEGGKVDSHHSRR